jgi:hypothetical protein
LELVAEKDWPDYLNIFRGDIGALRRREPKELRGRLAIFTCDLRKGLNMESWRPKSIRALQVKSTVKQNKSDGFCYWAAPYPCLVKTIVFKTESFEVNGSDNQLRFRILPFLLKGAPFDDKWFPPGTLEIDVHSWMLPGHGAALLWRVFDEPVPTEAANESTQEPTQHAE